LQEVIFCTLLPRIDILFRMMPDIGIWGNPVL
jgi:hypothetical protein